VTVGILLIYASYIADNYSVIDFTWEGGWPSAITVLPYRILAYPFFIFGVTSLFASAMTCFYSRYNRPHP
jgi:hypothetical protein